jgi:hypothetical protein
LRRICWSVRMSASRARSARSRTTRPCRAVSRPGAAGCVRRGLGCLGEPGVEPGPDLLWRDGAAAPLVPCDHDPGGRNPREGGQAEYLLPAHLPRLRLVPAARIGLDEAVDLTRTGDVWLFRGRSAADRAIQVTTNSPVNHVGMSVVLEDLPALMWHAELGRSLPDVWSGSRHRGAQLHDLRAAVTQWATRYGQRAWLRQLEPPPGREMEDALLRAIAQLDGTPFPSAARIAAGWLRGRLPTRRSAPDVRLDTAYCAEIIAVSYQAMGLLPARRPGWYDAGRFWSGDDLRLSAGARLGGEIAVQIPPAQLPAASD